MPFLGANTRSYTVLCDRACYQDEKSNIANHPFYKSFAILKVEYLIDLLSLKRTFHINQHLKFKGEMVWISVVLI